MIQQVWPNLFFFAFSPLIWQHWFTLREIFWETFVILHGTAIIINNDYSVGIDSSIALLFNWYVFFKYWEYIHLKLVNISFVPFLTLFYLYIYFFEQSTLHFNIDPSEFSSELVHSWGKCTLCELKKGLIYIDKQP